MSNKTSGFEFKFFNQKSVKIYEMTFIIKKFWLKLRKIFTNSNSDKINLLKAFSIQKKYAKKENGKLFVVV